MQAIVMTVVALHRNCGNPRFLLDPTTISPSILALLLRRNESMCVCSNGCLDSYKIHSMVHIFHNLPSVGNVNYAINGSAFFQGSIR